VVLIVILKNLWRRRYDNQYTTGQLIGTHVLSGFRLIKTWVDLGLVPDQSPNTPDK
jgi:hypothetical protein